MQELSYGIVELKETSRCLSSLHNARKAEIEFQLLTPTPWPVDVPFNEFE